MNSVIKVLDQHSANQIAAGEVVERPVSVVKELVENSLDAGARHIQVAVEGSGVALLQVRDDGCGMTEADLSLAMLRHATSKLAKIEDLNSLQTLGFRGEALPSIASVAHLEISSRPKDAISGHKLVLEAGHEISGQEVGCPIGTTITVRDLFFNTPARRKFLRSANTEFGLISDMLGRLALARPDVAITLTHPRQVVLQTAGRGELLTGIGSVLGNDVARRLLPIKVREGEWCLEGYISPPDLVRSSKQGITFIINGRVIRSTLLNRALQDGYHTLIPAKLHPMAVLHLHLPPSEFDVNVHPTKMDVRFEQENELAKFVSEHVYQTLLASRPLPAFSMKSTQSFSQLGVGESWRPNPATSVEPAPSEAIKPLGLSSFSVEHKTGLTPVNNPEDVVAKVVESSNLQYGGPNITAAEQSFLDADLTFLEHPLSAITPLAQLFSTYILASDGKNLILIDQHAAHERINYERLLKESQTRQSLSQALLIPIPMEFSLQEEQVVLEHLWALHELGFILEQFGPRTYLVRGVPACSGPIPSEDLLRQFIDQVLRQGQNPSWDQLLEEWIYLLACKESIKAKQYLSLLEMEQLIARLGQTENPYTCPHGRPTMIQLSQAELEKRFYRS